MRVPFDFQRFCRDHVIQTATSGHKHCQPGWIQTPCPFCTGNPGWHLGFNVEGNNLTCWRCGPHGLLEWIKKVTRLSHNEAKDLLDNYGLRPVLRRDERTQRKSRASSLSLPSGCGPMTERHREYLEGRLFDPDWLAGEYGLEGTGPIGPYKHRIIIPITHQGRLVSYQGRDVTGKSDTKYKACPKALEVMDHHDTLYGLDRVQGDGCVVVEGVADVWRLGRGAVGTFGIKFRPAQVRLLSQFHRVFVLFDTDIVKGKAESLVKAEQLAAGLASLGVEVELVSLDSGDPAEMAQSAADSLMRELGLRS